MGGDGVYLVQSVQAIFEELCGVEVNKIPLRHDQLHVLSLINKHLTDKDSSGLLSGGTEEDALSEFVTLTNL